MTHNEKIHQILRFICDPKFHNKASFNSAELTKAVNPEISLSEANVLCRSLIKEGDVIDVTTKDNQGTVGIMRVTETEDAYHTQKYLKENERTDHDLGEFNISNSNVNFGTVSESQNISSKTISESKGSSVNQIIIGVIVTVVGGLILWFLTNGNPWATENTNDNQVSEGSISLEPIDVTFKDGTNAAVDFTIQLVLIDSLLPRSAQNFGNADRAAEFLSLRIKNEVIQNLERMTLDSVRENRGVIEDFIKKETIADQMKCGYEIYALNLDEIRLK